MVSSLLSVFFIYNPPIYDLVTQMAIETIAEIAADTATITVH